MPAAHAERRTRLPLVAAVAALLLAGCGAPPAPAATPAPRMAALEAEIRAVIRDYAADTAEISVALLDLERGDSLLIDAHTVMHAASTMKVPVMLELFRLQDAGALSVDDPVPVVNRFRSIADGSEYALAVDDDSEGELYRRIGEQLPMRALIEPMITRSSNLATNILIPIADPARIARTLESVGAGGMRVLRGVEDTPAFERGMNNQTTAHAYARVLAAIVSGDAASPEATREMIGILERQRFREQIPAGVPEGVRVGSKTGSITRINHDGAVVMPEGRAPYVLVVLTRGFTDKRHAASASREISARVYAALVGDG